MTQPGDEAGIARLNRLIVEAVMRGDKVDEARLREQLAEDKAIAADKQAQSEKTMTALALALATYVVKGFFLNILLSPAHGKSKRFRFTRLQHFR